jgi:hypothetical protein
MNLPLNCTLLCLNVAPADHWKTQKFGVLRVTPIPAVDWRGDDQVSWIVQVDGHNYFHNALGCL